MGANRTGEFRVGRGITDVVAVDVDGTLLLWPEKAGGASGAELENAQAAFRGEPFIDSLLPKLNAPLIVELKRWLERRPHGVLVIWTMGGPTHAAMAARFCGFEGMRVVYMGKPDLIIDDAGEMFLSKKHPVVLPADFKCPEA